MADELRRWVRHMVRSYEIDALRLDTAPYVPRSYLQEWAAEAAVEVLGEVTASNLTFHASFTRDPVTGARVLAGVLNFPLYYKLPQAFCGAPPISGALFDDEQAAAATADLRPVADLLASQGLAQISSASGATASVRYHDVDLLGHVRCAGRSNLGPRAT